MSRRSVPTPPEIPGLSFIRLLGSGGFSDVYLYRQELPRREVAVKVLNADELSESGREAFVAEANVMAQLSAHPYIVTIYTADVAPDGRPYIVMEYVAGPTLAQRYRRGGLGVAETLRTGVRLSSAVATAHAAGILHRDIKPANVLSTDYGWPALTDFGISSAFGEERERGADAVGMSIPWSPAEVFDDSSAPDVRSDVFSLAATMYTVLAARTPFERLGGPNGSVDLISRIERGMVEPIGRDDIPLTLVAVLSRGLARRPEDRFAGAVEFARALQRIELELDHAPTPIDVPQALLDRVPAADDRVGADAAPTRVRSPHEVRPDEAPDADGAPVTQRTRGPERTVIRASPPRVGDESGAVGPDGDDGATTRRARGGGSAAGRGANTTAASPGAAGVRPESHPVRRVVLTSAAVVVVIIGCAVALIWGAVAPPALPEVEARQAPTVVVVVPDAQSGDVTPSEDGTEVRFSWRNPDPRSGDKYLVRRTDDGGGLAEPRLLDETSLTLTDVNPEGELCLQIQINRSGRLSAEPLTMCL
ncbi:protein kinase domain-containing protein [Mycetocola reblochoni]|uniref:serine/threonine-protein kinase n=1 Tax=Mycetocola reblochoni TaxID=331618 RepID=UPI003F9B2D31